MRMWELGSCEVQHVARCDFLLPRNLLKTCMCVLHLLSVNAATRIRGCARQSQDVWTSSSAVHNVLHHM